MNRYLFQVTLPGGCSANNLDWWTYEVELLPGDLVRGTVDDGTTVCTVTEAVSFANPLEEVMLLVDKSGGGSQWAIADFDDVVVLQR